MTTEKKTYQEQIAAIESSEFAVYLERLSKQVGIPVKSLMALALYNSFLGAGFREDSRATAAGERKLTRYLQPPEVAPARVVIVPTKRETPPVDATLVVPWIYLDQELTLVIRAYPATTASKQVVEPEVLKQAFVRANQGYRRSTPGITSVRAQEEFEALLAKDTTSWRGHFEISASGVQVVFAENYQVMPPAQFNTKQGQEPRIERKTEVYAWLYSTKTGNLFATYCPESNAPVTLDFVGAIQAIRKDPGMVGVDIATVTMCSYEELHEKRLAQANTILGSFIAIEGEPLKSQVVERFLTPEHQAQASSKVTEDWLLLAPTNRLIIRATRASQVVSYWDSGIIARVHAFNASPHCPARVTKAEYRSPEEFEQLLSSGTQPTGQFYWENGALKVSVNSQSSPPRAAKETPLFGHFYGRVAVFRSNTSQLFYTRFCADDSLIVSSVETDVDVRDQVNSLLVSAVNRRGLGFEVTAGLGVVEHGFKGLVQEQVPIWSAHYRLAVHEGIDSVVFS